MQLGQRREDCSTSLTLAALVAIAVVASACGGATPASSASPANSAAASSASAAQVANPDCTSIKLAAPGKLTVATFTNLPPGIVLNPDDTLGGFDGALLNAVAKDCKLQVALFQTNLASGLLAVQQHKADVITYVYYSEQRAKVLHYTYFTWVAAHTSVFYRSDFNYTGPSSCKTVSTFTGSIWAPLLQKNYGNNAVIFPDAAVGGAALLSGQVDCWINGETSDTPPLDKTSGRYKKARLKDGDFGMPESVMNNQSYMLVACDNHPLGDAINAELRKLVKDGTWAQVLSQGGVGPESAPTLSPPPTSADSC